MKGGGRDSSQSNLSYSSLTGAQVVNQKKGLIRRSMESANKAKERISSIKKSMEGFEVASLGMRGDEQAGLGGTREYHSGKVRSPGRQPQHGQISQMPYVSEPVMELQGRERGGARPIDFQAGPEFEVRVHLEETITTKAEHLGKLREAMNKNEIELQEKAVKRDDLIGMLSEQKKNSEELERKIKNELQEVRGKLEKMNIYKKRESLTQKQMSDKLGQSLKNLKQTIARLKKEKKDVEDHIASTRQDGEELYGKKMEQAQEAWTPMEEAIRTVEMQKDKHQLKLNEVEAEYSQLWNMRQMLHQDIMAKEGQCEELLIKKKELTIAMNQFKQKHEQELTLFFQELEFQREVARLENQRDILTKRLDTLEQQKAMLQREIVENRNIMAEGVNELEVLRNKELEFSSQNLVEIKKIETYMNKQAAEYGVAPMQQLIMEVLTEKGIHFEEEILKRQIRLVDDAEMNLLMQQSQREKDVKERIAALNDDLSILQEQQDDDPIQVSTVMQLKLGEIAELQQSIAAARMEHQSKLRAIQQWKQSAKREVQEEGKEAYSGESLFAQILSGAWELDKDIISEILKRLVGVVGSQDERSTMESLLNLYSTQVSEREGGLQHIILSKNHIQAKIQNAHSKIQAHEQRMETILTEITAAKADMANVAVKEQAIKKLVAEKKCELEFSTLQQGEQNFQKYLKDNQDIFSNVKRTYGAKVAEKMKQDQKKEFASVNATQLKKRRWKLQEMHDSIIKIDKILDRNSLLVNEELTDLSMQTQARLAAAESGLTKAQNQMAALTEAEEELVTQLEQVVAKKKEQLVQSVQSLFKQRRLDKNERRLNELNQNLEDKQLELERLENSSSDFERNQYDSQANFSIEATNLRTRASQLTEGLEQIRAKVRPGFTQMEKEIQGLNFEITGLKKRSQTLHDRMQLLKREIDISKSTLVDRYGQAALHDLPLTTSAELGFTQEDTMQLIIGPDDRKGGSTLMQTGEAKYEPQEEVFKSPEEFRPTKVDIQLSEAKIPIAPEEVSKLKEHFGKEQLQPTPHTFIHLVRLKYFPTQTLQLDFDDLLPNQTALLDSLKPLLGGVEVFRKVVSSSINSRLFDPKKNDSPESCGYGFRTLRIVPSLTHFELRKIDKIQHIEQEFLINDFVKQDIHLSSRDALRKSTVSLKSDVNYQSFSWVFRNTTLDLVVINDTALRIISKAAANLLKATRSHIDNLASRIQILED